MATERLSACPHWRCSWDGEESVQREWELIETVRACVRC